MAELRDTDVLTEREAGFRRLISSYRSSAKRRGISWELDDFSARILLTSACFYCGSGPRNTYNRRGRTNTAYPNLLEANGIDRLDSGLPYSVSNTVPACWTCNRAKNELDFDQFRDWLKTVTAHLTSQGLL